METPLEERRDQRAQSCDSQQRLLVFFSPKEYHLKVTSLFDSVVDSVRAVPLHDLLASSVPFESFTEISNQKVGREEIPRIEILWHLMRTQLVFNNDGVCFEKWASVLEKLCVFPTLKSEFEMTDRELHTHNCYIQGFRDHVIKFLKEHPLKSHEGEDFLHFKDFLNNFVHSDCPRIVCFRKEGQIAVICVIPSSEKSCQLLDHPAIRSAETDVDSFQEDELFEQEAESEACEIHVLDEGRQPVHVGLTYSYCKDISESENVAAMSDFVRKSLSIIGIQHEDLIISSHGPPIWTFICKLVATETSLGPVSVSGACFPEQESIALEIFQRAMEFLQCSKDSLLEKFNDFQFLVLTPTFCSLRNQTTDRVEEAGLLRKGEHHKVIMYNVGGVPHWNSFKNQALTNKKLLSVLVADECHWGARLNGFHDKFVNDRDLCSAQNVLVLLVSATPLNCLTSKSRVPEKGVILWEPSPTSLYRSLDYFIGTITWELPNGLRTIEFLDTTRLVLPRQSFVQYHYAAFAQFLNQQLNDRKIVCKYNKTTERFLLSCNTGPLPYFPQTNKISLWHLMGFRKQPVFTFTHSNSNWKWESTEPNTLCDPQPFELLGQTRNNPCCRPRSLQRVLKDKSLTNLRTHFELLYGRRTRKRREHFLDPETKKIPLYDGHFVAMDYLSSLIYFSLFRINPNWHCPKQPILRDYITDSNSWPKGWYDRFEEALSLVGSWSSKPCPKNRHLKRLNCTIEEPLKALRGYYESQALAEFPKSLNGGDKKVWSSQKVWEYIFLQKMMAERKYFAGESNEDESWWTESDRIVRDLIALDPVTKYGSMTILRVYDSDENLSLQECLRNALQKLPHLQTPPPSSRTIFSVIGDNRYSSLSSDMEAWTDDIDLGGEFTLNQLKRSRSCRSQGEVGLQYSDLKNLPCLVILCEKGRMGDTFPHTLKHLDLRLRTAGMYTSFVQEFGRVCRYPACAPSPFAVLPSVRTEEQINDLLQRAFPKSDFTHPVVVCQKGETPKERVLGHADWPFTLKEIIQIHHTELEFYRYTLPLPTVSVQSQIYDALAKALTKQAETGWKSVLECLVLPAGLDQFMDHLNSAKTPAKLRDSITKNENPLHTPASYRTNFKPKATSKKDSERHYDAENKRTHDRRLLLMAQCQQGKTGVYLKVLQLFQDSFNLSISIPCLPLPSDKTSHFSEQAWSNLPYWQLVQAPPSCPKTGYGKISTQGTKYLSRVFSNRVQRLIAANGNSHKFQILIQEDEQVASLCGQDLLQAATMSPTTFLLERSLNISDFKRLVNWDGMLKPLLPFVWEELENQNHGRSKYFENANWARLKADKIYLEESAPKALVSEASSPSPISLSPSPVSLSSSFVPAIPCEQVITPLITLSAGHCSPAKPHLFRMSLDNMEFVPNSTFVSVHIPLDIQKYFLLDGLYVTSPKPYSDTTVRWIFHLSRRSPPGVAFLDYQNVLEDDSKEGKNSSNFCLRNVQIVVVLEKQREDYSRTWGKRCVVISLPSTMQTKSNKKVTAETGGSGYSRLFIQLLAYKWGLHWVWVLDDNVRSCLEMGVEVKPQEDEANGHCYKLTLSQPKLCSFSRVFQSIEELVGRGNRSLPEGLQFPAMDYSQVSPWAQCKDPLTFLSDGLGCPKAQKLFEYSGSPMMEWAFVGINRELELAAYSRNISTPFSFTHSIYSFFFLNVKATVNRSVFYPPKPIWEDREFAQICQEKRLCFGKWNKFFHIKTSLQGPRRPLMDRPSPQVSQLSMFPVSRLQPPRAWSPPKAWRPSNVCGMEHLAKYLQTKHRSSEIDKCILLTQISSKYIPSLQTLENLVGCTAIVDECVETSTFQTADSVCYFLGRRGPLYREEFRRNHALTIMPLASIRVLMLVVPSFVFGGQLATDIARKVQVVLKECGKDVEIERIKVLSTREPDKQFALLIPDSKDLGNSWERSPMDLILVDIHLSTISTDDGDPNPALSSSLTPLSLSELDTHSPNDSIIQSSDRKRKRKVSSTKSNKAKPRSKKKKLDHPPNARGTIRKKLQKKMQKDKWYTKEQLRGLISHTLAKPGFKKHFSDYMSAIKNGCLKNERIRYREVNGEDHFCFS